jgi:dTDP-glucose 4,6-dehydratase
MRRILITGGAGFIGSNLARFLLNRYPQYRVTVLDALTSCGSLENFDREVLENPMFSFWHGDVRDADTVGNLVRHTDVVVHMAAETHADRSIEDPARFIDTDVRGTQVLLSALRRRSVERFIHISSSEVYGAVQALPVTEEHPLLPQSPCAGAKVGADRLAYSYHVTYDLPVVIVRPFNVYGPYQCPEKAIPMFITNAIEDKPLPVYGDGSSTRDWLHVEDFCHAVDKLLEVDIDRLEGEVINIGTGAETSVNTIVRSVLRRLGKSESLARFVDDKPGHVQQLVSSTSKAEVLLDWKASVAFEEGIGRTVDWYVENRDWWRKIKK